MKEQMLIATKNNQKASMHSSRTHKAHCDGRLGWGSPGVSVQGSLSRGLYPGVSVGVSVGVVPGSETYTPTRTETLPGQDKDPSARTETLSCGQNDTFNLAKGTFE